MAKPKNTPVAAIAAAPAVAAAPAAPKPIHQQTLDEARAANPTRYANVERIVAWGAKGQPVRVVVRCAEPQTRLGVSVCEGTREIASQDLFQVRCCAACADRLVRRARRDRAKRREKTLRAEVVALKAAAAAAATA